MRMSGWDKLMSSGTAGTTGTSRPGTSGTPRPGTSARKIREKLNEDIGTRDIITSIVVNKVLKNPTAFDVVIYYRTEHGENVFIEFDKMNPIELKKNYIQAKIPVPDKYDLLIDNYIYEQNKKTQFLDIDSDRNGMGDINRHKQDNIIRYDGIYSIDVITWYRSVPPTWKVRVRYITGKPAEFDVNGPVITKLYKSANLEMPDEIKEKIDCYESKFYGINADSTRETKFDLIFDSDN